MQARNLAILNERSNASLVVMAILFGLLTIGMETVFQGSFRLPGHRAFPGALGLLLVAQAFAPLVLLAFAGAVSSVLVSAGYLNPWFIGVWVLSAALMWLLSRTRLANSIGYFLLCGLCFGLLSFLVKLAGIHHTPQLIRASGHLAFGLLGGLTSFAVIRGLDYFQK